jgi:DNA-binding transcriptional LysR family regulator
MLTTYGEQFVERAKHIVAEFEDLHKWSSQISGLVNSKLSFGASAITTPHASACIPDFIAQFPEIQFSYTEQWDPELLDLVKEGSLDVALVDLPKNSADRSGLRIFPICEEYVCVVVSNTHPLHGREIVHLQALANEQIVSTSIYSGLTRLMKSEFALYGLNPHFSMNLISIEARLSVVKKGAVTFVMNEQFKIYDCDDISVIPIEPKIYRTLSLVTAANRTLSIFEKTFIQIIREGVAKRLAALQL